MRRRLAVGLIGLCGLYQLALGAYFIAIRPPLLSEDFRFLGLEPEVLGRLLPRLATWLDLVFTVLGGQMAALGVLVIAAAMRLGSAKGDRRELALIGVAGLLSVGVMSAVNFALRSDFRWLLIVPVLVWAIGLGLAASFTPGAAAGRTRPRRDRR